MNIVIKTSCPIWSRPNLTAIMSILLHFCHTFTGKWNDSCFKYKNCSNVLLNQCYKQATSINQLFGPNIFNWNIFDFFTNKLLSCQIHIVLAFWDPISLIKSLCTEAEAKACLLSNCFLQNIDDSKGQVEMSWCQLFAILLKDCFWNLIWT